MSETILKRSDRLDRLKTGLAVPLSFLVVLNLYLALTLPNFATRENFKQIAVQAAFVAILACGQTVVILSGNIDLSVGANMALAGIAAAIDMKLGGSILSGVLVALGTGMAAGIFTGIVAAYGKIPAFIATLGMMGVLHGLAGYVSNSVNIEVPRDFRNIFGFGELFGSDSRDGIPYAVLLMLIAAIVVHLALSKTKWGRAIYAMGGNREAARLSGLKLDFTLVSAYALSGLLAGLAAIVNISRASVASKDAGIGYELDAVAATVIGGTSLFGGQGGIPGAIIGAALIYTLRNACALKGLGPDVQRMIIGGAVILAALYDRFVRRR